MKNLLVYSSLTGNTKKVGEACHSICDSSWEIRDIKEEIDLSQYDKIALGCWIDKGTADAKSLEFIKNLNNKDVAFFVTLGAYPDSAHAFESLERIKVEFEKNSNRVHSHFICQGAVDPKLIDWMKKLPSDHAHAPNADRVKRWDDAAQHPNNDDFENAKNWFKEFIK